MTSDLPYLQHVLDAVGAIGEFTREGREEFLASRLVRDATLRNLQTLAEATKRLSPARKDAYPEVPWRRVADFRNVLVHEYERVDPAEVWRIVEHELPVLERAVRGMLAEGPLEPAPKESTRGDA